MRRKIAIVQVPPAFMDFKKTISQSCESIFNAKKSAADIVMFPEAYVPGYPDWIWRLRPGTDHNDSVQLQRLLVENSVDLSANGLAPLLEAAKENDITVAVGFSEINAESSRTTIFNSYAIIGPNGKLLNVHRKLVPTSGERMVWGRGDASGLNVVKTKAGRIGGLICWENYMPLSRYALYTQGVELYLAPTWDYGDTWISTLKHIAKESGCWVAGCATAMQANDMPDSLPARERMYADSEEWLNDGDAILIRPSGKIAAGPLSRDKGILYAEYDLNEVIEGRRSLDVAGHYSRPELFELTVKKSRVDMVNFT